MDDTLLSLVHAYTLKYLDVLSGIHPHGPRSYGFEYEFLPYRIMTPADVAAVCRLLPEIGFAETRDIFQAGNGLQATFEPGGQIEYSSPPLFADDDHRFDEIVELIQQTNCAINERLGIEYIGTDYMSGRIDAPLCLTSDRYLKLHARLAAVGTRDLEMMKGTASIHLHVVISTIEEMLPIFKFLCRLSETDGFSMSATRRDIWNHTDPCRCGIPPCCSERLASSEMLIRRFIQFALRAEVFGENNAFSHSSDLSFEIFLYHMTTLFTDVRFNLKGPTLEMRTMDSMPVDEFKIRWHQFLTLAQSIW